MKYYSNLLFVLFVLSTSVWANSWDLVNDYSGQNNPNGPWSYGRKWTISESDFDLFTAHWGSVQTKGWYLGGSTWSPSIQSNVLVWANDNRYGYPVVRWTAPQSGVYSLAGKFWGADSRGVDSLVYVAINGDVIFNEHVTAYLEEDHFSFESLHVNQGDKIDFIVKWAGNNNSHDANWTGISAAFEQKNFQITFPNGGEFILADSNQNIMWNNLELVETNVMLKYTIDGGLNWISIGETENDGSYQWHLPILSSNNVLVNVTSIDDPSFSDTSDSHFTIYECSEDEPADFNDDCVVDLADFQYLVSKWLWCGNPFDISCN